MRRNRVALPPVKMGVDKARAGGNFPPPPRTVRACSDFPMTASAKPILYVKPGCPWCHEVAAYLHARGIGFRELNVLEDAEAFAEMRRKSGQSRVPTMDWDGKVLADFGVAELVPFLKKIGAADSAKN